MERLAVKERANWTCYNYKKINLWKREGDKLVFQRILNPGEVYRVYRYDRKYGGQYGVGGDLFITNISGYVKYQTPSKAILSQVN